MTFPPYVTCMIDTLRKAGFSAYAVGGCVRDTFLGRTPADWDVTTSAEPWQTMEVFSAPPFTVYAANGLKHGTVTVSIGKDACEITTYRTEGAYTDHRRPDEVHFVTDIIEDLARRDFTVNAMAASPGENGTLELIDPFGGQADLRAGILRAVGDPVKRMTEDALRILRGIRFAARYDFSIEKETAKAMHTCSELLDAIAPERIGDEMRGILKAPHCQKLLVQFSDIAERLFPGCTVSALSQEEASPTVRLACLLTALTAEEAQHLLLRYAFGNATAKHISQLLLLQKADLSQNEVRCAVADRLGKSGIEDYFAYRRILADTETDLALREREVLALFEDGACYNTATLAVRGADLLAAGFPPSPRIGQILDSLTRDVIAGKYKNDRDTLIRAAIADHSSSSASSD